MESHGTWRLPWLLTVAIIFIGTRKSPSPDFIKTGKSFTDHSFRSLLLQEAFPGHPRLRCHLLCAPTAPYFPPATMWVPLCGHGLDGPARG